MYVCMYNCMYTVSFFQRNWIFKFSYYSYCLSSIFIDLQFSPIFYPALLFALKSLSETGFKQKCFSLAQVMCYIWFMVLFLSLLAFYSEIQGWVLGTLIFSYIRRLGPFFGFKILNFNIFGGFQNNEYF